MVRGLFERFKTERLRALVAWIPMMSEDDLERATAAAESFRDERVHHGWDRERRLGALFSKTLKLMTVAWDIYLLYPPGVVWGGETPPEPAFWMHQLPEEHAGSGTLLFSPALWAQEVCRLLQSEDIGESHDLALLLHAKGLLTVRAQSGRYSLDDITAAVLHPK